MGLGLCNHIRNNAKSWQTMRTYLRPKPKIPPLSTMHARMQRTPQSCRYVVDVPGPAPGGAGAAPRRGMVRYVDAAGQPAHLLFGPEDVVDTGEGGCTAAGDLVTFRICTDKRGELQALAAAAAGARAAKPAAYQRAVQLVPLGPKQLPTMPQPQRQAAAALQLLAAALEERQRERRAGEAGPGAAPAPRQGH